MQNRCDLMNGADLFRNLSFFFRYIAKIYAWRMNDLLHLYASRIKTVQDQIFKCRNLTLSMQDSQHTVIIETRCLFMFHCLHYFLFDFIYILLSFIFLAKPFTKKTDEHGFSTSSNLHSLHELYPQEGIA